MAALQAEGFSETEIGHHAGLRDTSELMDVRPEGIRAAPIAPPDWAHPGSDGAPERATPEMGRRMLELKIEAALRQIAADEARH
jgi:hypothetical protein